MTATAPTTPACAGQLAGHYFTNRAEPGQPIVWVCKVCGQGRP